MPFYRSFPPPLPVRARCPVVTEIPVWVAPSLYVGHPGDLAGTVCCSVLCCGIVKVWCKFAPSSGFLWKRLSSRGNPLVAVGSPPPQRAGAVPSSRCGEAAWSCGRAPVLWSQATGIAKRVDKLLSSTSCSESHLLLILALIATPAYARCLEPRSARVPC